MKILIATPLLPSQSGGPAQYTVGLMKALEEKGHTVDVVAFQNVAHFPTGVRHLILFFQAVAHVKKTDAVIVLDTLSMALPFSIATFFLRKKIIMRTGGDFVWEHYVERTKNKIPLSKFYNSSIKLSSKERLAIWIQKHIIFPLVDTIVFSTAWQKNIWSTPYNLKNKNTVIIENAYALGMETVSVPNTLSNEVVWIGRNITLKNVDLLDNAIENVQKTYPNLEYKKYSQLPHEEIVTILRSCRFLIVPSISEVSPNLALEALGLGIPVLLTKECGLVDTLQGAVTWIDPMSVENIEMNIQNLMTTDGYADACAKVKTFQSTRTYTQVADEFLAHLF